METAEEKSVSCGICLEDKMFSDLDFTCTHCFFYACFDCLFEYIRFNKKRFDITCPQCRRVLENLNPEKLTVTDLIATIEEGDSSSWSSSSSTFNSSSEYNSDDSDGLASSSCSCCRSSFWDEDSEDSIFTESACFCDACIHSEASTPT